MIGLALRRAGEGPWRLDGTAWPAAFHARVDALAGAATREDGLIVFRLGNGTASYRDAGMAEPGAGDVRGYGPDVHRYELVAGSGPR